MTDDTNRLVVDLVYSFELPNWESSGRQRSAQIAAFVSQEQLLTKNSSGL
jgi:hypothetical protein